MINNGIVLKKEAQVHRGWTWKTVHQTHKLQRSSISKKLEQGKRLKEELHSSKVWRRRDLRSEVDRSFPSKHLEFRSRQIHHRTRWGTALHKSMLRCPSKLLIFWIWILRVGGDKLLWSLDMHVVVYGFITLIGHFLLTLMVHLLARSLDSVT